MRVQPPLPFVAPALLPRSASYKLQTPSAPPPRSPLAVLCFSPPPVSPKHISRLLIDSWFAGFQCASELNHPSPSPLPLSLCCPIFLPLPSLIISPFSARPPSLKCAQHPSPYFSPSLTSAFFSCFPLVFVFLLISFMYRPSSIFFQNIFLPCSLSVLLMRPLEAVLGSTPMQQEYSF